MRALHAHHAAWLSDRCSCREKKQCGRLSDRTLRSPALMLRMYQPAGLMEDCLNRFAGQRNRSGTHSLATVCRGWGRQAASDCGGGRRVSVINFCFEHDAKPRTGCRERFVDLSARCCRCLEDIATTRNPLRSAHLERPERPTTCGRRLRVERGRSDGRGNGRRAGVPPMRAPASTSSFTCAIPAICAQLCKVARSRRCGQSARDCRSWCPGRWFR